MSGRSITSRGRLWINGSGSSTIAQRPKADGLLNVGVGTMNGGENKPQSATRTATVTTGRLGDTVVRRLIDRSGRMGGSGWRCGPGGHLRKPTSICVLVLLSVRLFRSRKGTPSADGPHPCSGAAHPRMLLTRHLRRHQLADGHQNRADGKGDYNHAEQLGQRRRALRVELVPQVGR